MPTGLEMSSWPLPVTSCDSDTPICFVTRPVSRMEFQAAPGTDSPSRSSTMPMR